MLPSFCRDVVTITRAPLVESRGTKIRDWSQATTHTVAGCSVQPGGTDGTWGEQRNGATVRATLYAPPGANIEFADRVSFGGVAYSIDGAPQEWRSPTGRVTHMTMPLIDWRG